MKTDFTVKVGNTEKDKWIALYYKNKEVLYWDSQEWIDEPNLVLTCEKNINKCITFEQFLCAY